MVCLRFACHTLRITVHWEARQFEILQIHGFCFGTVPHNERGSADLSSGRVPANGFMALSSRNRELKIIYLRGTGCTSASVDPRLHQACQSCCDLCIR